MQHFIWNEASHHQTKLFSKENKKYRYIQTIVKTDESISESSSSSVKYFILHFSKIDIYPFSLIRSVIHILIKVTFIIIFLSFNPISVLQFL